MRKIIVLIVMFLAFWRVSSQNSYNLYDLIHEIPWNAPFEEIKTMYDDRIKKEKKIYINKDLDVEGKYRIEGVKLGGNYYRCRLDVLRSKGWLMSLHLSPDLPFKIQSTTKDLFIIIYNDLLSLAGEEPIKTEGLVNKWFMKEPEPSEEYKWRIEDENFTYFHIYLYYNYPFYVNKSSISIVVMPERNDVIYNKIAIAHLNTIREKKYKKIMSRKKSTEATTLYRIEGNYICDVSTGKPIYRISGDYIDDIKTGKPVYRTSGKYIDDIKTGKPVYRISGDYIDDIKTGEPIFRKNGTYIESK